MFFSGLVDYPTNFFVVLFQQLTESLPTMVTNESTISKVMDLDQLLELLVANVTEILFLDHPFRLATLLIDILVIIDVCRTFHSFLKLN